MTNPLKSVFCPHSRTQDMADMNNPTFSGHYKPKRGFKLPTVEYFELDIQKCCLDCGKVIDKPKTNYSNSFRGTTYGYSR